MPITLSYDLQTSNSNQRNYIRSMLERFGWKRLGGSVFRYDGRNLDGGDTKVEDWLNDVAPSLMFFRSYVLYHSIEVRFLTLDTSSVTRVDFSDPSDPFGLQPLPSGSIDFSEPTNNQSSLARIKRFLDASVNIMR